MNSHLPMMVEWKGRRVVVAGGGRVALKRVKTLMTCLAEIIVVSPSLHPELSLLEKSGEITCYRRTFTSSDSKGTDLLIIATSDQKENDRIAALSERIPLINRVDGGSGGNVHFPGFLKRGRLTISVSTDGASPMLASKLKQRLESEYGEGYGEYVDFLHHCRTLLKESSMNKETQHDFLREILKEDYHDTEAQKRVLDDIHSYRKGGGTCQD
ncbi:NAD(P)-dependent oxidoreductase [Halobacillus sp. KGW1]|uniref:NAD(P)-dependent oxidoreductase n=1 Tax=Halobacillus sp. KGW1 TaxID=1793726 RepID=UPI00078152F0|nr:NAD(P)-dependent oxidoreductase [Halobacillus sp. KGW1]